MVVIWSRRIWSTMPTSNGPSTLPLLKREGTIKEVPIVNINPSDPVGAAILETGVKMLIENGSLKFPGIAPGQEVKIECKTKKKADSKNCPSRTP